MRFFSRAMIQTSEPVCAHAIPGMGNFAKVLLPVHHVRGAAAAKFTGSGGATVVLCRDRAQEQALQGLCKEEGWSLHAVRVGPPNFATVS